MPGVETSVAPVPQASRLTTSSGFLDRYGLLLLVALGAALRFGTIGTQSSWLDKQVPLDLVRRSPGDLQKGVVGGDSNPAPYYVLGGSWERLFGTGELGSRSLSALLGTATIPALYAAARELGSRRAGTIAAAFVATFRFWTATRGGTDYEAPRPVTSEKPHEQFTPRVFSQAPAG